MQPTQARPWLLLASTLGLLSPLLAVFWYQVTSQYLHFWFLLPFLGGYLLAPMAVWMAAKHRRTRLMAYSLLLAIPAAIGIDAYWLLGLSEAYSNHPHQYGLGILMLVLAPITVGIGHVVGGLSLVLAETIRQTIVRT